MHRKVFAGSLTPRDLIGQQSVKREKLLHSPTPSALHIGFIAIMMQILYAAFLSFSIIGIPAVSAQNSPVVRITSANAATKCLTAQGYIPGSPVLMLVHSTVDDDQLMNCFI